MGVACWAAGAPAGAQPPAAAARSFSVTHYVVEIEPRIESGTIAGSATLTIALRPDDVTGAGRTVVLDRGRLVQVGRPAEIFDRPKTRFVAEFVGKANILTGRMDSDGRLLLADGAKIRLNGTGASSGEVSVCLRPHNIMLATDQAAEDVVVPPPGVVVEFDDVERRAVRALAEVGLVPPLRHRDATDGGAGGAAPHGRRTG